MNREDFVTIRLSAAGCAAAHGAPPPADYDGPRAEPCVRVAGGGAGADSRGYEFEFAPDEIKDVTRAEWAAIFEPLRDGQGQQLFEIVQGRQDAGDIADQEES